MNIKRFTAPTSREALAKARMAFGDGTLILSNRPTANGVEVVATAIFVIVILGVTGPKGQGAFAGLAIGLTLAVIHIVGIQVTGVSVNPARSFGPAVLQGGEALSQVWLFFAAPALGAALGALLFRFKVLEPDA